MFCFGELPGSRQITANNIEITVTTLMINNYMKNLGE